MGVGMAAEGDGDLRVSRLRRGYSYRVLENMTRRLVGNGPEEDGKQGSKEAKDRDTGEKPECPGSCHCHFRQFLFQWYRTVCHRLED